MKTHNQVNSKIIEVIGSCTALKQIDMANRYCTRYIDKYIVGYCDISMFETILSAEVMIAKERLLNGI